MKYQLAIFDFDGTLANILPWFFSAVNRMAEKHGFKRIEDGEVDTLRGYNARQIVAHLGYLPGNFPGSASICEG